MDRGVCGSILVRMPGKAECSQTPVQLRPASPRAERNKRKEGFRNQKRSRVRKRSERKFSEEQWGVGKLSACGRKEGSKNAAQPKQSCYFLHLVKNKDCVDYDEIPFWGNSHLSFFPETNSVSRPLNRDFCHYGFWLARYRHVLCAYWPERLSPDE